MHLISNMSFADSNFQALYHVKNVLILQLISWAYPICSLLCISFWSVISKPSDPFYSTLLYFKQIEFLLEFIHWHKMMKGKKKEGKSIKLTKSSIYGHCVIVQLTSCWAQAHMSYRECPKGFSRDQSNVVPYKFS